MRASIADIPRAAISPTVPRRTSTPASSTILISAMAAARPADWRLSEVVSAFAGGPSADFPVTSVETARARGERDVRLHHGIEDLEDVVDFQLLEKHGGKSGDWKAAD